MGNRGWHGTREEWSRIEGPLLELDPIIDDFASKASLTVTKNLKDCPERSMRWGNSISCLIQIYLEDPQNITWNIWICCSSDNSNKRYWKRKFLIEKKVASDFKDRLPELLAEGRAHLIEWSDHPETLEFATVLDQHSQHSHND